MTARKTVKAQDAEIAKPKRVRKPKVKVIEPVEIAVVDTPAQPELPLEQPTPAGMDAIDLSTFKPNRQQRRSAAARKTRVAKNGKIKDRAEPRSEVLDDGYRVLHPTKGWRTFTKARLGRTLGVEKLRMGWAFIARKMSDAQLSLFS